jgi:biotin carboxylase
MTSPITSTSEAMQRPRVMLLMSPATYRAAAFINAAQKLNIDVVTVVDMPEHLREYWGQDLAVAFADLKRATADVTKLARDRQVEAILSVDDSATELAALAARELGLAHNSPDAAVAARDKFRMRSMLADAGVRCPHFELVPTSSDPAVSGSTVEYPCVVKPTRLSGSRGVIRANDEQELIVAFQRLRQILKSEGENLDHAHVLIESYIPGGEVALEGLLTDGDLHVLALFDKPDPLVGPFFEETIYVTPSRLPATVQQAIADETAAAARALGLAHGPIHAELRVNETGPWMLEIAGRSIGGLCSTILSFGSGMGLEELILRHATSLGIPSFDRERSAVGVMMIPIPKRGLLRDVGGVEEASATPLVTGIEITARLNYPINPLPEGASYLGFIFARGETPEEVEAALRTAHERLDIRIDPMVRLMSTPPVSATSV